MSDFKASPAFIIRRNEMAKCLSMFLHCFCFLAGLALLNSAAYAYEVSAVSVSGVSEVSSLSLFPGFAANTMRHSGHESALCNVHTHDHLLLRHSSSAREIVFPAENLTDDTIDVSWQLPLVFVNDRPFALFLESASDWQWLAKCPKELLSQLHFLSIVNLQRPYLDQLRLIGDGSIVLHIDGLSQEEFATIVPHCRSEMLICDSRFISDLSPLENLEGLTHLWLCGSTEQVEGLSALRLLRWVRADGLNATWVTAQLEQMSELETLVLNGCSKRADIGQLSRNAKLRHLHIESTAITTFRKISNLTSLETLSLASADSGLPPNLSGVAALSRLVALNISFTDVSNLSEAGKLNSLQVLIAEYCNQITQLTPLSNCNELHHLDIEGSKKIQSLEPLKLARNLKVLKTVATSASALSGISPHEALTQLFVTTSDDFALDLAPLAGFKNLNKFTIEAEHVKNTPALASLSELEALSISACSDITDLASLSGLKKLRALTLSSCEKLVNISALASLGSLRLLEINLPYAVEDYSVLKALTSLEVLRLHNAPGLDSIALSGFQNLRVLDLYKCNRLTKVSLDKALASLQVLKLDGCSELVGVGFLSHLTNLEMLSLADCSGITSLPEMPRNSALRELWLDDLSELATVAPLADLDNLEFLSLSHCSALTDVSPLKDLAGLRHLNLAHCKQIAKLPSLHKLTRLTVLYLNGNDALRDISALESLAQLRRLDLSGCDGLADISPLAKLESLVELGIGGCESIEDISPISSLPSLRVLYIYGLKSVTDFSPLLSVKSLQKLVVDRNLVNTEIFRKVREGLPKVRVVSESPIRF